MHIATMGLRALVDLEHTFCTIGKCQPGGTHEVLQEALWEQCQHAMGMAWCRDFKTASEAAAMIIALALLKQIEIVEDR